MSLIYLKWLIALAFLSGDTDLAYNIIIILMFLLLLPDQNSIVLLNINNHFEP